MRKFKPFGPLAFLLFFSITICAQQSKWPKTLLWRISGNGLTKSSFLYGTMHVQDKRLFYFSDSLYHSLEQAEGFAMEVDVQELIDSVMIKAMSEAESESKGSRDKDYSSKIDSLLTEYKSNKKDKALRKILEDIRRKKLRKAMKNQDMPTIMDAYLYGIARRQGKWLGGIEDVQDQLDVYDELGNDVESEALLAPDVALSRSLEQMISLYLSQDLEALEKYCVEQYSEDFTNKLLFQRNRKMAWRMDSLSHLRSMFFAIGAAHLPGDSGVITLLRKMGFLVEPVMSSKKIDPFQYASKLDEIPWMTISDADKTYEIQMPAKPSDFTMYGDLMKMKVCTDITTLTYYMSGSMISTQEVNIDRLVDNLKTNSKYKTEDTKKITVNGLKGVETVMTGSGYYCKVQYLVQGKIIYMLIAGGEKKEVLNSTQSNRFLSSFVAKGVPAQLMVPKEWQEFSSKEKGFHVQLPGTPKQNKSLEKSAEGTNWKFEVYDLLDASTSSYYIIQVRDLLPSFYLQGDSTFFSSFLTTLPKNIDTITKREITTVSTFPAFRMDADGTDKKIFYKVFMVNRGNRVYTIIGIGERNTDSEEAINKVFSSFTIDPYLESTWKKQTDNRNTFFADVPDVFTNNKNTDDEDLDKDEEHYVSYNTKEAISYEVFKGVLPPYYWAQNDSLYFDRIGRIYVTPGDSVIKKQNIQNGKIKGVEWIIQMPANNNLKKVRQLLNGDTVYSLISFIPTQYINEERHNRFFESFRVVNENISPTIFKSKASKLLNDLLSDDSTTIEQAREALIEAEFAKEDKALLEQALIENYADDTASRYYTTRDRIVDKLSKIADEGTVEFIRAKYETLKGENEHVRFNLIDVLAKYKTSNSYSILKYLLLNHTPSGDARGKSLSYSITDSLQLARTLFPELLTLSSNPLFADDIIRYSKELLDSNYIDLAMLMPFKKNFLYTADTALQTLIKTDSDEYPGRKYENVIKLLEAFQDEECDKQLERFLLPENLDIKYEAVKALIRRGKNVSAKELTKLAGINAYRRYLFNFLSNSGKEKLFPSKFRTQKAMSESDIFIVANDEDNSPEEIKFLEERTAAYKGKKLRFYLYKLTYSYEDDNGKLVTYSHLGITGGFSINLSDIAIEEENDVTGVYYDEEFDPKKVNEQFMGYLQEMEEFDMENGDD